MSPTQRDTPAAPLGRRLLAAGIDAACILGAIAGETAAAAVRGWRDIEAGSGRLAALRDDPKARMQATMDVYATAGVNPSVGCWQPLVPVAAEVLLTVSTPRRQSPDDWIAGTVVVRD
jgi:hypothetical protein